jgi:uncharacterized protein involved in type VI secretion and phage assembly
MAGIQDNSSRDSVAAQSHQFFGKYRGIVADSAVDKERRGRLLIQVPQVLGETQVWAEPCVPFAGKDVGFFMLPKKGTGLWVEFEAGDPSYPIWTGCVWAPGDIASADHDPSIKFIKTEKFSLRIDDKKGEVRIESRTGSPQGGSQIVLGPIALKLKGSSVTVEGAGGKTIELDVVSMRVNKSALEVL